MSGVNLGATAVVALLGGGLGFGAGRLVKPPWLQSVLSCVSAWVLASIFASVLWMIRAPGDAEVLAVAWHFPKLLTVIVAVGMVALVAHAVLGTMATAFPAALAWRPIVLGVAGALAGLWGYPGGSGFGEPLR